MSESLLRLRKRQNFVEANEMRRDLHILTAAGIAEKSRLTIRSVARKRGEYEALRQELEDMEANLVRIGTDGITGLEEGRR